MTADEIRDFFTDQGHVKGMLDRDQRTAKMPHACHTFRNSNYEVQVDSINKRATNQSTEKTKNSFRHSRHKFRRNNAYMWKTLLRLRNVLIVGVYISLFDIPSVSSAPTNRPMAERRMQGQPKWINPCGMTGADNGAFHDFTSENSQVSDKELLSHIIYQANYAFSHANGFKDDFIYKNFETGFEQLHETWKDQRYTWLPSSAEIPKHLGEQLPQTYLQSLDLDDTLLNANEYLQKVAVGLEQIVWDQEDEMGPHTYNFTNAEHNLRLVLCEIQTAIYERRRTPRGDVTRDIMPDELRHMVDTNQKLRNWLIYRDYMNALEYVIQCFSYLKPKD